MKKTTLVLLASAIFLASCGNGAEKTETTTTDSTTVDSTASKVDTTTCDSTIVDTNKAVK